MEIPFGKRTYIMGILNVTPNSFSDGGLYQSVDAAVEKARQLVDDGADILDIGGESTRPGASGISLEEELARVIPVIEQLVKVIAIPISVDTTKAEVARQALQAGAHIINDVWGCKADSAMAETAAQFDCPIVLMHNRVNAVYTDLLEEVVQDLQASIVLAKQAGVRDERIIIDPGIGFGKTYIHNLQVMHGLERVTAMGYPLLLGTSRKRMIQHTLGLPADDVKEGTAATVTLGIAKGADIVRVHDVKEMKRVAMMADAMVRLGGNAHG